MDVTQLLVKIGADTTDAETAVRELGGLMLATVGNVVETALESYAQNERLGQSLESLVARELRNKDATLSMAQALEQAGPKAEALLRWNQQLAINSPFTEEGVAKAFRTAQAYGFVSESADKSAITAKRVTQALIDYAAGSGQSEATMNSVALALGQIEAKGKLAGQEVLQLVNAGVAVDQILAKAFGKSTAEIVALREQGIIPADAAVKAIVQSLENDFGGSAKRQANSIAGLQSSLEDLYRIGARNVLGPAFESAQPYIQKLAETLQDPKTETQLKAWGEAIGQLVSDGLPKLIQGVQEVGRFLQDAASAAQPFVDALAPAFRAMGDEIGRNLKPLTDLIQAYREMRAETDHVVEKILAGSQAWQESEAAVKRYRGASDEIQGKLRGEAGSLELLQDQQKQAIAQYAQHMSAYQQLGIASGQSEERLTSEREAINARGQAIIAATQQLTTHISTEEQAAQAASAQASAQQQAGLQLQLTAEQVEKYRQQLEKVGESGAQAYDKLAQAQTEFGQQEAERAQQHQARLTDLDDQAARDRLAAERSYHEKAGDQARTYHEKVADLQRTASTRTAEIAQREQERAAQSAEQLATRVQAIQERAGDQAVQYLQQRQEREAAYQERVSETQRSAATRAAETEARVLEQREQQQQQYTERVQQLAQQLADVQQRAADAAADRQRSFDERLADMRLSAEDRRNDSTNRFNESKEQREQDHGDRLGDLQAQLGAATNDKQRASLERQIAQENEKYAKQEARAQQAFDRQQQQAERELEQQIAKAERQRQIEEQKAQEQLTRQEQQLQRQQQQLDAAQAVQEAKAAQTAAREQAQRETALAAQLAQLERAHVKELAQGEQKFAAEQAQTQKQLAAERASYTQRETEAAAHARRDSQQRAAQLAEQLADAQRGYARQQEELDRHYTQQQQDQAAELERRRQAENDSSAKQAQDAARAYAKQEAQLRETLGKQLAQYVTTQQAATQITADEAQRRLGIIAAETGFNKQQDAANTSDLITKLAAGQPIPAANGQPLPARGTPASGGGYVAAPLPAAGATPGGAGGAAGTMQVTIDHLIVQGIDDPYQWALKLRDILVQLGKNGGAPLFGGYA